MRVQPELSLLQYLATNLFCVAHVCDLNRQNIANTKTQIASLAIADCMANYSRTKSCTAVWMYIYLPCCEDLLPLDCNSVSLE